MYACANLSFVFKEAGPLLKRFEAASKAGFKYAECDYPGAEGTPLEVGRVTKESGLKQVLINCFQGDNGEMGFAATPGGQDDFRHSLNKTLEYAREMQCQKIHILSGRDLGPDKMADQVATLEANLTWAAQRLAEVGVVGVIEPINPHSKPGYFLKSFDVAVSVIEKVQSPQIRLQLDLFHLQMITGDVTNNIKRLLPVTGHVQVAQSPHRHEPSCSGELDMKYVFEELRKAGYKGPVGCEYSPSTSSLESLSWIPKFGLTM